MSSFKTNLPMGYELSNFFYSLWVIPKISNTMNDSDLQTRNARSEALSLTLKKIACITKGLNFADRSGKSPVILREGCWREAYLPSHNSGKDIEFRNAYSYWQTLPKIDGNFDNWIRKEKGSNWLAQRTRVIDGQTKALNVLYFENRSDFEVTVLKGSLIQNNKPLISTDKPFSFVMSPQNNFYAGAPDPGVFHHSSMLAGAVVLTAGEIKTDPLGRVISFNNCSGHYKPPVATLIRLIQFFKRHKVDLSQVQEVCARIVYIDHKERYYYRSVKEFLEDIDELNGTSTIEILTTLKLMKDFDIDITKLCIGSKTFAEFIQNLEEIHACSDPIAVKEQMEFLKEIEFDFSKIKKIVTYKNVSAVPILRFLKADTSNFDNDKIEIQVIYDMRLQPFMCKLRPENKKPVFQIGNPAGVVA